MRALKAEVGLLQGRLRGVSDIGRSLGIDSEIRSVEGVIEGIRADIKLTSRSYKVRDRRMTR